LTVFAAAHPSAEVGQTVAAITKVVPQALTDAEFFVTRFIGPNGSSEGCEEARAAAQTSHAQAEELAQKLLAEVRASAGPGGEPNA
jgi:hypothetical protein